MLSDGACTCALVSVIFTPGALLSVQIHPVALYTSIAPFTAALKTCIAAKVILQPTGYYVSVIGQLARTIPR